MELFFFFGGGVVRIQLGLGFAVKGEYLSLCRWRDVLVCGNFGNGVGITAPHIINIGALYLLLL